MTLDLFSSGATAPEPVPPEETDATRQEAAQRKVAQPHGAEPRPPFAARPAPERPDRERALAPTAVNAMARELLEGALPPLWVAGEVAGWKRHSASGHCYFALRDARAQIRCVMFESDARLVPTDPEEGMKVAVFGSLTLYERRGEYQLKVTRVEAEDGDGLWRLAFDRLKAKLEGEGLLAPERKRRLPRIPETVGVVTSPVGAALHDILRVIRARAPWTRVVFSPARVQGPGASQEVARAIRLFGRAGGVDVLIVGRGGGSVEDLWAFNEEPVARAIAECPVPVVSAVGHEVDITIADLVADLRAPTPSGAAELVVPDGAALERELAALDGRLRGALRGRAVHGRREIDRLADRIRRCASEGRRRRRERILRAAGTLDALSPLGALARGYAVPLGQHGRVLRRREDFVPGSAFRLRVVDGEIAARTEGVDAAAEPGEASSSNGVTPDG